ncbi:hypothetical protein ACLMJK_003247 [Lecanora helva]
MSPKESARILALLNASFKQQLNRQHPAGLDSNEHLTDLHIRSILTNPLLCQLSKVPSRTRNNKAFSKAQDILKGPMEVFVKEVAAGSATPQIAACCLKSHFNNCLASPDTDISAAMRASGASKMVTDWLWSSGLEESGNFFKHLDLMGYLTKFLIAEGHSFRIRRWLERLQQVALRNQLPTDYQNYKNLLSQYISSETSVGKGLESATRILIQIMESVPKSNVENRRLLNIHENVAFSITFKLMDTPKTPALHSHTVEPFRTAIQAYCKKPTSSLVAFHDMYLIRVPNPNFAFEYFKWVPTQQINKMNRRTRSRLVFLGLKTAELLLERNRQSDAILTMDLLQDKFRDEIGLHAYRKIDYLEQSSEEEEARSIRLLDGLAVA